MLDRKTILQDELKNSEELLTHLFIEREILFEMQALEGTLDDEMLEILQEHEQAITGCKNRLQAVKNLLSKEP